MHGVSTRTLNLPRAWNLEEQWLSIASGGSCAPPTSPWNGLILYRPSTRSHSCYEFVFSGLSYWKTLFHCRYPLPLAPGINLHHLPWCSLDLGVCVCGGWYKCIDTYSLHFKQLRISVLTSILHTKMLLSGGLRAALGYGVVMLLQWCICGRHLGTVSV